MTVDVVRQQLAVTVGDQRLERLDPRRMGSRHLLVAAAEQYLRALLVGPPGQLGDESRLADAGFAHDQPDRRPVGLCRLPELGEPGPLLVASGERPLTGDRSQRSRQGREGQLLFGPRHAVRDHRVGQTLQLQFAGGGEREFDPAPGQTPHEVVAQHLRRPGGIAEPGGRDHRGAVTVVVLPRDVAGAQADPDRDPFTVGGPAPLPIDRALHVDGRFHRLGRPTEGGHETVAETLHQRAAVALDDASQDAVVATAELLGRGVAERRSDLRARDDVGEQDRRRPHCRPHGRQGRRGSHPSPHAVTTGAWQPRPVIVVVATTDHRVDGDRAALAVAHS